MPWSLRIFRIAGVGVYLHVTFILLLAVVAVAEGTTSSSLLAALLGITFFLSLFACVLAHEFGHILMARKFGVGTKDVTLFPIGGVARLNSIPEKPRQELWVALAGPAVNVVIVFIVALWIVVLNGGIEGLHFSLTRGGFAVNLMSINLIMIGFNMLPAFPMDGGRVLRAFLATRMDFTRATRIAASLGRVMAVLFVVAGLFWFKNPFLIFIAFVVWFGAGQEARQAIWKSKRPPVQVRHVMMRDFHVAHKENSLSQISNWIHHSLQTDFPVTNEQGHLLGMVQVKKLLNQIAEYTPSMSVGTVMATGIKTLEADQALAPTLARFNGVEGMFVPVVENEMLVGLLPVGDHREMTRVRQSFIEQFTGLNLQ